MTKNIIFIIAALCSLQARADVQPTERDTVHRTYRYDDTELLQPLQPLYLDGVVVPARGNGNWFVSIAGGATAFLGTPLGCEDLFGRLKPSYSLALGKWFTPWVGARINYNGLQFKDGTLAVQEYHYLHADLLWNVLGGSYVRQKLVRWHLAPFAGIGLLHHATNGHNPFAISYGIQGQYRISKRVSALMELSGTTTFQDFDGYGKANRLGDHDEPQVIFFNTPGTKFELYPLGLLAKDISETNPPKIAEGFAGITLAYNVERREEVDVVIEKVCKAGGRIAKEPAETFWGGYHAYFSDLDGYYWEVVWGPMFEYDENGLLKDL